MNRKLYFFLSIVFLDGMVMGITIPAMPLLVAKLNDKSVTEILAWGGGLTAIFGIAQFLISPWLGALSDTIGRRKVLIIALIAMASEFIILLCANNVWMLVLAQAVGGAGSANRAVMSAAIADTHHDDQRAHAMGSQTAAFAIGLLFGPALGSLALLGGLMLPLYFALVLICINILTAFLLLQETLDPNDATPFIPPYSSLKVKFSGSKNSLRGRLRLSYLLYSMAFIAYPALWSYYAQGVLNWSPLKLSLLLAVFCAFLALANMYGIRLTVAKWGHSRATITALYISIIAAASLALSPPDIFVIALFPMIATASIADALIVTAYANTGDRDEQGMLQGHISALRAAAIVISPPILSTVMAWTNRPDAAEILSGGMFAIVALLNLGALHYYKKTTKPRVA